MAISRMDSRYVFFLLSGKYSEGKIIKALIERDSESFNYRRFFITYGKIRHLFYTILLKVLDLFPIPILNFHHGVGSSPTTPNAIRTIMN